MKDESLDKIGPDRNTVQPPKAPASKVPEERLTTAGSKVTHDVDPARSASRPKRVRRALPAKPNDKSETWLASGVAKGWDGSTPPSKAEGPAKPPADSLFARDDEGQRRRAAEPSPHRLDEQASNGESTRSADSRRERADERASDARDRPRDRSLDRDIDLGPDEVDDHSVSPLRSAVEWAVAIGLAIFAALIIKTFLLQAFVIPSGSMLPTLQDRDRVLVSKQTYRFVDIERGDVVVFDNPDWQPNEPEQLIKRVIGLPGDSVEVRDGNVIVNGKVQIEDYLDPDTITDNEPRTIVPDDAVFVMGDNRRNSKDSRVVGPIALDDFTGHAFIRIWPPSRIGGL